METGNMLYGLLELLATAIKEFHHLAASNFTQWLILASGFALLMEIGCFLSGRLVRSDWTPNLFLGSLAGIAFPITFALIMLLPASPYLKPAVTNLLGVWQQKFLADQDWNGESFRQEYWAVKALKNADGTPLESFADCSRPPKNDCSPPKRVGIPYPLMQMLPRL